MNNRVLIGPLNSLNYPLWKQTTRHYRLLQLCSEPLISKYPRKIIKSPRKITPNPFFSLHFPPSVHREKNNERSAPASEPQCQQDMKVARTLRTFYQLRNTPSFLGASIGFVPTMGALHRGHLALIQQARRENDRVIVSIYVNPTQFAPHEDLSKYPRPLEKDLELLREASVDVALVPENDKEMYDPQSRTIVQVQGMDRFQEGRSRTGHFQGVTTVVSKLFQITQPTRAYFGQKDVMQCYAIKRMVKDLNFPGLDIVIGETIRESDGLALSSRNVYLSPEQREWATSLIQGLREGETAWKAGTQNTSEVEKVVREYIQTRADEVKKKTNAQVLRLEYVECVESKECDDLVGQPGGAILSGAMFVGTTRLIDNLLLPLVF